MLGLLYIVAADGGCERDMIHRMNEELMACVAMKCELSDRDLCENAKNSRYEGVYVIIVLFRIHLRNEKFQMIKGECA